MGDQRIRYGLAYGRMNNFYAGLAGQKGYLAGTDGLLAQGDTTPDVTNGFLFYTNNSGATTITNFDLQHPSAATVGANSTNLAGLFEGKAIKVMFLDSNTTVSGSRLFLAGTDSAFNSNGILDLIYHNSGWYEMSRTNPYRDNVSFVTGGSTGLSASYNNSIFFTGGSAAVVVSVSGGVVGQRILLINGNSSTNVVVTTDGNIRWSVAVNAIQGSGLFTITSSGVGELIKTSPTLWALNGR